MTETSPQKTMAGTIASDLPFLRRYARALTGQQSTGDAYAAATLEAILEDTSLMEHASNPRVALFHAFHSIWKSSGAPVASEEEGLAARAQSRMSTLTPDSREVLLLSSIEEFSLPQIAEIMDIPQDEVADLLSLAHREMRAGLKGRVQIIEDESIIALDLQSIVDDMGHEVTHVAATAKEAVADFKTTRPDLILSDIQLADGSSGIDAVNEILKMADDVPVIFITAFPERLLTGDRPEPAFVITKPFTEAQVQSAVSQAIFFASTESLQV
ncbi:response regulator [Pseudooceanicola sp.]|uniref:response regulator n=1 Tax=Pseudooceanicola sp. TaxID=1914328 RepID=UPI0035C6F042